MASVRTPREAGPTIRPPAPLIAALEGRYRLAGEAGRGGMSRVWIARDLRHERDVVVKAVDTGLLEVDSARRFLREIEVIARLNHPHVVPLLDSGAAEEWLYYVMPRFVDGSLADRLRGGRRFEIRDALGLAGEIADALAFAHDHGVVHRDVKPQNVLMAGGHALLADFGLAYAERSGTALTPHGTVLGTPSYMSPEQASGQREVDARSDQYALACVVYEMLAGQPPFDAASADLLAWMHQQEAPPPLESLRADVPYTVARAVQRAMAKRPEDRFADVAAFREALAAGVGAEIATGTAATRGAPPPRPATVFVGREQELWTCLRVMDDARWLTIGGPGGVGKTRLAHVLAERLHARFAGGTWFVDLSGIPRAEAVPEAIRAALANATLEKALVILDNCEHVHEACRDWATSYLAGHPSCALVATSRVALGGADERVFPLPPLSLPPADAARTLDGLAASEAARLFIERARATRPGIAFTNADAAGIAAVCQRLDGLPLAIELAAALLPVLSLTELVDRLEDRLRLLAIPSESGARHRTLEATLRWSDELLSDGERRLFHELSVFRGGATLEAVAAICSPADADAVGALERVSRLVRHSLVVVEAAPEGPTRYRLLETIRDYASRRLAADGEGEGVRQRHAGFYRALADRADAEYWGPDQAQSMTALAREHDNLLAALDWCRRDGAPVADELLFAYRLYRLWYSHGFFDVAREALDHALSRPYAEAQGPLYDQACFARGGIALLRGELETARRLYDGCIARTRARDDRSRLAGALVGMGLVEAAAGRPEQARTCYEESLALFRELGDPGRYAVALHNLAELHAVSGEFEPARGLYEECIESARRSGNRNLLASALAQLGQVLARSSRPRDAAAAIRESLQLSNTLGTRRTLLDALDAATVLAIRCRDRDFASRLYRTVEAERARFGVPRERTWTEPHRRATAAIARLAHPEDAAAESIDRSIRDTTAWLETRGRRATRASRAATRRLTER